MHIAHSQTAEAEPAVDVSEPWQGPAGVVFGPDLHVWPLGRGTGHFWACSLQEAEELRDALSVGIAQARELFPDGES